MPWYKAGTVSVVLNSNAVIGVGSAFIANCRVGDGFRGPDGAWYEVTNIASDTAMSISPDYQGATVAAGSYALAPMQGYVKDSADSLRTVANQFGGTLSALGDSGTVIGIREDMGLADTDGMPEGNSNRYFTESRVLATPLTGLGTTTAAPVVATDSVLVAAGKLQAQIAAANTVINGKAAKGVNSDITSLSGLTAPLSVAQGGTGATTAPGARAALELKSAALADAVGLVANGAIIESGSNTSGVYIKYVDGTQICRCSVATNSSGTYAVGALFGSDAYQVGWPAAFISIPTVAVSAIPTTSNTGIAFASCYIPPSTIFSGSWRALAATSQVIFGVIQIIGIGRWKA